MKSLTNWSPLRPAHARWQTQPIWAEEPTRPKSPFGEKDPFLSSEGSTGAKSPFGGDKDPFGSSASEDLPWLKSTDRLEDLTSTKEVTRPKSPSTDAKSPFGDKDKDPFGSSELEDLPWLKNTPTR